MALPAEIEQFILERVESVADLEALLLLRREPASGWAPSSLAARLYIDDARAQDVLARLVRHSLAVARDEGVVYAPASEHLRALVDTLAELHGRLLIPMTHLIHNRPNQGARQFADAFRLRDKK